MSAPRNDVTLGRGNLLIAEQELQVRSLHRSFNGKAQTLFNIGGDGHYDTNERIAAAQEVLTTLK